MRWHLKPLLNFMLISLDSHWKVPCGYFLINGLSEKECANIVKVCLLTKLHEAGVRVTSLTCDGLCCILTIFKDLGASVEDASAMSTSFPHPVTQQKVNCLLDAFPRLKLVRNALSSLGCIRCIGELALRCPATRTLRRVACCKKTARCTHSVVETKK